MKAIGGSFRTLTRAYAPVMPHSKPDFERILRKVVFFICR